MCNSTLVNVVPTTADCPAKTGSLASADPQNATVETSRTSKKLMSRIKRSPMILGSKLLFGGLVIFTFWGKFEKRIITKE